MQAPTLLNYLFSLLAHLGLSCFEEAPEADSDAEKGGAIEEMKEEIALQKVQLASQQEELVHQKDQLARQNGAIAMLRETIQNLVESHALASTLPESIPQFAMKKSLTTHTAEMEDACSDEDVREGEASNTMKDETTSQEGHLIST